MKVASTRGQEPYSRGDAEVHLVAGLDHPARPVLMGKKKKHRFVGFDPAVGSDGNVTVTATGRQGRHYQDRHAQVRCHSAAAQ